MSRVVRDSRWKVRRLARTMVRLDALALAADGRGDLVWAEELRRRREAVQLRRSDALRKLWEITPTSRDSVAAVGRDLGLHWATGSFGHAGTLLAILERRLVRA